MRDGGRPRATGPGAEPALDLPVLRANLLRWYALHQRSLPWRAAPGTRPDPYAVWISEVMLQQTQVVTATPYFQRWMARFPTLEALAAASVDEVLQLWQGLGYYGRARRLHEAAQLLIARGGGIPADPAELRALPGVGDYSAGALLSIAFGRAHPAIDGNVRRVLGRIGALEGDLTRSEGAARLRALAQGLLDAAPNDQCLDGAGFASSPGDLNQALMELGARVCRPRQPDCSICPVQRYCLAHGSGREAEFPQAVRRTPPRPATGFAYAIRDAAGRWLLGRRRDDGLLGGLWEFPWLESNDADERPEPLSAHWGPWVLDLEPLGPAIRHAFTHLRLDLRLLRGDLASADPQRLPERWSPYVEWRWVALDGLEARSLPMSRLMDKLRRRLAEH